jgi:predicted nuclease of predicted toxin-antitoxin system
VLKAYADEHVLSAIVHALRQRGMDVVTVQDRQGEWTDDAEVLSEAMRDSRVVLTNDTDFLVLAARCATLGKAFAPIFFWPQQSRRRVGEIVRSILRAASRGDYATACSRVHFL